ncbi:hypothetical protein CSA_004768 [Cucumis sativus]|uniref:Uncharacterized protein n=1 Tax=Cucumis sativus TaxID=3659 RepID=A0ACB6HCA3_CUCSA|nr:hypothetical protein CSA_004768 [Cucumis sativus]
MVKLVLLLQLLIQSLRNGQQQIKLFLDGLLGLMTPFVASEVVNLTSQEKYVWLWRNSMVQLAEPV